MLDSAVAAVETKPSLKVNAYGSLQVMSALSILEMFLRNAYEHGMVGITAAVLSGGLSYVLLQPYLPDFEVLQGGAQVSLLKMCSLEKTRCDTKGRLMQVLSSHRLPRGWGKQPVAIFNNRRDVHERILMPAGVQSCQ
jgi:hypothetical protein